MTKDVQAVIAENVLGLVDEAGGASALGVLANKWRGTGFHMFATHMEPTALYVFARPPLVCNAALREVSLAHCNVLA